LQQQTSVKKKMKEPKPYLLTLVTVFLLISLGLLAATIYLYFNSAPQTADIYPNKKNSSGKTVSGTRDSLEKIYAATIKDLDASFAAIPAGYSNITGNQDLVNIPSGIKNTDTSAALEKLRNEISSILSDKNPAPDLTSAKAKISELQVLVDELKNKNTLITKENERLFAMLKQVTGNTQKSEPVYKNTNEAVPSPKAVVNLFKADDIQVSATTSTDFIEKETTRAEETDNLVGSFILKNNSGQNTVSEVMVVVVQPDGKILQTSNWETGVFYTSAGKQIYSKKLRFNNNSGESKKLNFSLQAEKYLPGKYTIEVYHDGAIIGRAIKILS
jgi:hypothetical protein